MKLQIRLLVFPLLAACISACTTGAPGLPARKKMPELVGYAEDFESTVPFEGRTTLRTNPAFAFATSNMELTVNGVPHGFVAVALPDAANDSAAISLINNIKPFALPLISNWAISQQRGVAIDLSRHNGAAIQRSDYVLEKAGDFAIPVVILWDAAAAGRLATLRALVNDVPSVQLKTSDQNSR